MKLWMGAVASVTAMSLAAPAASAKDAAPQAGKAEKVCRHTFPTGEKRAGVCKKAAPCCAWDAINYTKCGSTITGCLRREQRWRPPAILLSRGCRKT